jgi:hypothetical protein
MTVIPSAEALVKRLVEISLMLDKATDEVAVLDEEAVVAKQQHRVKYAKTFVTGQGAVDTRHQLAIIACGDEWLDMELAEQKVRACKERIRTLRDQLEIARSLSAALRSEWAASGIQP